MNVSHHTDDAKSAVEAAHLVIVRRRTPVLNGVSLSLASGETIAIMGPNGAGKSTLLKCLAGALRPTAGFVTWFGNSNARSPMVRRQIGFVGHETGLYDELTALENLTFSGQMYGVTRSAERAGQLLSAAGLAVMVHRPVGRLSQGVRQRVAIARALVHQPQFLVLDEPFASLDAEGRQWLERLFHECRRAGRTMCFSGHDELQSRELADRIIWLEQGSVAATEQVNRTGSLHMRIA
jgi:heme exporter protein A